MSHHICCEMCLTPAVIRGIFVQLDLFSRRLKDEKSVRNFSPRSMKWSEGFQGILSSPVDMKQVNMQMIKFQRAGMCPALSQTSLFCVFTLSSRLNEHQEIPTAYFDAAGFWSFTIFHKRTFFFFRSWSYGNPQNRMVKSLEIWHTYRGQSEH